MNNVKPGIRSIRQVAKQFNVAESNVRHWMSQYDTLITFKSKRRRLCGGGRKKETPKNE